MSLIGRIKKDGDKVNIPGKGLVMWKQFARFLKVSGLLRGIKLSVDGAEQVAEIEDGLNVKIAPAVQADTEHPFKLHAGAASGGVLTVTVTPGAVNSMQPASFEIPNVPDTGTQYIYLNLTYTLTATTTGYTYGATFDDMAWFVDDAAVTDPHGPSTGEFYILIGTITDGEVSSQPVTTSLSLLPYGTTSSKAIIVLSQS